MGNLSLSRRQFVNGTLAAAATGTILGTLGSHAEGAPTASAAPAPGKITRKIRLGIVGMGTRGLWISKLFRQHGGYEMHAVADYFPHVADKNGATLGVDKARRFSGLSGYTKVIESGVEAIVIVDVPYFFHEQARAAVEAGLHVFLAKPVAVDVPGCLSIEAAGKKATQQGRVFLVDYQMPTDPVNMEIVERIHNGGLGKIAYLNSFGCSSGHDDPPKAKTIENRLQQLVWTNDIALGGDYIGNFSIHSVDVALWVAGQRPVAATGASSICRDNPHGDSRDVCQVVYEYADGLIHTHCCQALPNLDDRNLVCKVFGAKAYAQLAYSGKVFLRGGPRQYVGEVRNLYDAGTQRNIVTFYRSIIDSHFDNPTVRRSVDGCLTCILGREAAARKVRLTMDELIRENKRLEVDLSGLNT